MVLVWEEGADAYSKRSLKKNKEGLNFIDDKI